MGKQVINLVKLCVGVDSVEHLQSLRDARAAGDPDYEPMHVTRMWPKREDELLNGGSLYWVVKGVIRVRSPILRLDEVIGHDGIRRCGIVMSQDLIPTAPAPRRPFQGWRYLSPQDAPVDLPREREDDIPLPDELADALNILGLR